MVSNFPLLQSYFFPLFPEKTVEKRKGRKEKPEIRSLTVDFMEFERKIALRLVDLNFYFYFLVFFFTFLY